MKKKYIDIALVIFILIYFLIIYFLESIIVKNIKILTLLTVLVVLFLSYLITYKRKKINTKELIIIAIIIGILIRGMYIVYTPYWERQHDVFKINEKGHLGYIYQIYDTGKLPQTNKVQFYHPPLFHFIGASWLKINSFLHIDLNKAIEGLQILTAIFSSFILIYVYKITEYFNIKEIYKLLINLIMIFHPTFIILSGSINNDILMILLIFIIILYLIKWEENSNIKNTIILAIVTGLAVMTKVSAGIMAVPILYIFIKKYLKEIKKNNRILNWNLLKKISLFAIISLAIGLWYPIRNWILFAQPLGWILHPSQKLNVAEYGIVSRFLTLSFEELFLDIFVKIPQNHNILAYMLKTSILGEFIYKNMTELATILKILNLVIVVFSIICTLFQIFSKSKKNKEIINLLIILWTTNIISYYIFNIKYPYLCTMNFRYIVPTVFSGIVCICNTLDNTNSRLILKTKNIIIIIIMLFCLCSLGMFFII